MLHLKIRHVFSFVLLCNFIKPGLVKTAPDIVRRKNCGPGSKSQTLIFYSILEWNNMLLTAKHFYFVLKHHCCYSHLWNSSVMMEPWGFIINFDEKAKISHLSCRIVTANVGYVPTCGVCLYTRICCVCTQLHVRVCAVWGDGLYLFPKPHPFCVTMVTKENRMGTCRLATWPGIFKPQAAGTESRLTEKVW